MVRIWRFITLLAVILLVAGMLLAGTGWITGASMDRIREVYAGQMHALWETFSNLSGPVASWLGMIGP